MDNQIQTADARAVELPHDFVVAATQQILLEQGTEAQKGSRIAKESLLDSVTGLKKDPIMKEVLDGMQKENLAKVRKDKAGNPTELVFDAPIAGYPRTVIKVDIAKGEVNNKGKSELEKEAKAERSDFISALTNAPNRPLPDGSTKALDQTQRKIVQSLTEALVNGDIQSATKLFQTNPADGKLWNRIIKEVENDLDSTWLRYGKDPTGAPYLAVGGSSHNYDAMADMLVIPAKGAPDGYRLHGRDETKEPEDDLLNGEVNWQEKSTRAISEIVSLHVPERQGTIERKVYDYKCDFDAHERKKAASVPLKTIVQKYNSYSRHLCGEEAVD